MNFRYCSRCEKETGHKRALGVGTIIMVCLTLGLWLLIIPVYPTRCIHCGTAKWSAMDSTDWWPNPKDKDYREKLDNRKIGYAVLLGALVLIFLIGLMTNNLFKSGPKVQTYAPYLENK